MTAARGAAGMTCAASAEPSREITVRGVATAEELAAVLAVVAYGGSGGEPTSGDPLSAWRAIRLAAVRETTARSG